MRSSHGPIAKAPRSRNNRIAQVSINDMLAGNIENQDMIVVHFVVVKSGNPVIRVKELRT